MERDTHSLDQPHAQPQGKQRKRESKLVAVLSTLALIGASIAIVCSFVPFVHHAAVVLSLPALLVGILALGIAFARDTSLFLPTLALLLTAVPAAQKNVSEMRVTWIESPEVCNPPRIGGLKVIGILASAASSLEHPKRVGTNVCAQIGKRFSDHECGGPVARLKCEP